MSLFLDTRGKTQVSIAICDRCRMKRSITKLVHDANAPGLRVCGDTCRDVYDPYRLPARRTENITLQFPRPDATLTGTFPPSAGTGQIGISFYIGYSSLA